MSVGIFVYTFLSYEYCDDYCCTLCKFYYLPISNSICFVLFLVKIIIKNKKPAEWYPLNLVVWKQARRNTITDMSAFISQPVWPGTHLQSSPLGLTVDIGVRLDCMYLYPWKNPLPIEASHLPLIILVLIRKKRR